MLVNSTAGINDEVGGPSARVFVDAGKDGGATSRPRPTRPRTSKKPLPTKDETRFTGRRLRGRHDGLGIRGGFKRQGQRGRRLSTAPKCVPLEGAASRGLRFPADKATPQQIQALDQIVTRYLRRKLIRQHADWPADIFAAAFGVAGRQAAQLVKDARNLIFDPDAELTAEILGGMLGGADSRGNALPGRVAGVLGYPRTAKYREVFRLVRTFDIGRFERRLHERLVSIQDGADARGEWTEADRDLWNQIVSYQPMVMLKAAFDLDYLAWAEG